MLPAHRRDRSAALHDGARPACRRAAAQLARADRRGLLRPPAVRRRRRPAPGPLALLRAPRRAAGPPERAPLAGPHHGAARRPQGRPRRRLARGGGVGRGQHRRGDRPAGRPRPARHDRRDRLRLRTRLGSRRGDHGAPRGGPASPTGSLRRSVEMLGHRSTGGALVVLVAEVPADDLRAAAHLRTPLRLPHDRRTSTAPPGTRARRSGRRPTCPRLRVTRDSPFATAWNTDVRTLHAARHAARAGATR